jgi:hypothetical protein
MPKKSKRKAKQAAKTNRVAAKRSPSKKRSKKRMATKKDEDDHRQHVAKPDMPPRDKPQPHDEGAKHDPMGQPPGPSPAPNPPDHGGVVDRPGAGGGHKE